MKPGYKQTDVGVIPEEWEVKLLPDVCRFRGGKAHEQHISEVGPFVCVNSKFISTDGKVRKYSTANFCPAKRNDVLMVMSDLPNGRALAKAYLVEQDDLYAVNQRVCALTAYRDCPAYLFYILNRNPYFLRFDDGVSQTHLLNHVFQKCQLPMPPTVAEQRAIAEALGDVDALLGALDRLIAKKRDLKQAAMQQLLTGQTRLPGFHGVWEVKRMGELGATFGGLTGKTKDDFGEGSARYITFMNIMTNVVIDCVTFEQVKVSPSESQNRAVKGDLFFNGSSETPEEVAMCAVLTEEVHDVFLNSFCFGFRFRAGADADGKFLAYYFRSREGRELMKSLAQGSTRYNLSKTALLKSPFRLPPVPEQTAIASVLAEMDAEMAALAQRLTKTHALKQAMMQELLTGRLRLSANATAPGTL